MVRVKNRSWHELEKGDIPLEKLALHFEAYNRSEGKSPRTIEWYSRVIAYLSSFLSGEGYSAHLSEVDVPREIILYLQTKTRWTNHPYMPYPNGNLAAISVQTYVRGLRAFFGWLQREGYTKENLLADLKPPKAPCKLVEVLREDEIQKILSCLDPIIRHRDAGTQLF